MTKSSDSRLTKKIKNMVNQMVQEHEGDMALLLGTIKEKIEHLIAQEENGKQ